MKYVYTPSTVCTVGNFKFFYIKLMTKYVYVIILYYIYIYIEGILPWNLEHDM